LRDLTLNPAPERAPRRATRDAVGVDATAAVPRWHRQTIRLVVRRRGRSPSRRGGAAKAREMVGHGEKAPLAASKRGGKAATMMDGDDGDDGKRGRTASAGTITLVGAHGRRVAGAARGVLALGADDQRRGAARVEANARLRGDRAAARRELFRRGLRRGDARGARRHRGGGHGDGRHRCV
jgi:hypothetical protein